MLETRRPIDIRLVLDQVGITAEAVSTLASTPSKHVARVDTAAGETLTVKVAFDAPALAAEVENNTTLAGIGAPVPDVVDLCDVAIADNNAAALVMAWIHGDALSGDAPHKAQQEAGELLRRIHEMGGGPPYHGGNTTYADWIKGWLDVALPWWSTYANAEWISAAWNWFDELRPLIAGRGCDTILFDGRPEHFIVNGDRIAGIIDLADLTAGDSAMDLGVIAANDPKLLPGILAGYNPTTDDHTAFAELVPFYEFLRAIAAAEWNLSHGDKGIVTTMLDRAAHALANRRR